MAVFKLKRKDYSDAAYVAGVYGRDPVMERAMYLYCKKYFDDNYKGVFFIGDDNKDEVFQEAFLTLWENIIRQKIYAQNGKVIGKGGEPLSCELTTYFMSIAKHKYIEWARHNNLTDKKEEHHIQPAEMNLVNEVFEYGEDTMIEIIADCVAHMSKRCNQIITMFYYNEMTLDDIMTVLPTFESKNALKTAKYKCMENLRNAANEIYNNYLNS